MSRRVSRGSFSVSLWHWRILIPHKGVGYFVDDISLLVVDDILLDLVGYAGVLLLFLVSALMLTRVDEGSDAKARLEDTNNVIMAKQLLLSYLDELMLVVNVKHQWICRCQEPCECVVC